MLCAVMNTFTKDQIELRAANPCPCSVLSLTFMQLPSTVAWFHSVHTPLNYSLLGTFNLGLKQVTGYDMGLPANNFCHTTNPFHGAITPPPPFFGVDL